MKVVPFIVGLVNANGVPSLDSSTSTISCGRSDSTTVGFNFTMQTRDTSEPTGQIGPGLLLVKIKESGAGTEWMHAVVIVKPSPLKGHP